MQDFKKTNRSDSFIESKKNSLENSDIKESTDREKADNGGMTVVLRSYTEFINGVVQKVKRVTHEGALNKSGTEWCASACIKLNEYLGLLRILEREDQSGRHVI